MYRLISVPVLVFLLFQDLITGWDDWYDGRVLLYCHEGFFCSPKWLWNLEDVSYFEDTEVRLHSIQILPWSMCESKCGAAMRIIKKSPHIIRGPLEMSD